MKQFILTTIGVTFIFIAGQIAERYDTIHDASWWIAAQIAAVVIGIAFFDAREPK